MTNTSPSQRHLHKVSHHLPPINISTEGKLGHRHNDNAAESTNYSWFSKQIERGNGSNALEVFKDIIITFKKANLKKQTE